jgi:hypothetical protein
MGGSILFNQQAMHGLRIHARTVRERYVVENRLPVAILGAFAIAFGTALPMVAPVGDRPLLAEQRPIARSEPITPPDLTVLI